MPYPFKLHTYVTGSSSFSIVKGLEEKRRQDKNQIGYNQSCAMLIEWVAPEWVAPWMHTRGGRRTKALWAGNP